MSGTPLTDDEWFERWCLTDDPQRRTFEEWRCDETARQLVLNSPKKEDHPPRRPGGPPSIGTLYWPVERFVVKRRTTDFGSIYTQIMTNGLDALRSQAVVARIARGEVAIAPPAPPETDSERPQGLASSEDTH